MIYIVGGGASGMMSAIAAAEKGKQVTVLERKDRVGKKLLATGNGCCNFTNINLSSDNYHCGDKAKLDFILSQFGTKKALDFFNRLGIYPKIEEDGKIYPYSYQASSVLDCLRNEMNRLEVNVIENMEIETIKKKSDKLLLVSNNGQSFLADKAVIACGGKSACALGSNGSGYKLLKGIGHSVTKLTPALVQLKTDSPLCRSLKGVKVNGRMSLLNKGQPFFSTEGDILFTDYGISGQTVFQGSFYFHQYGNLDICLDFLPDVEFTKLVDILMYRQKNLAHLSAENYLTGLINKKLGMALMKYAGIKKLSVPIFGLTNDQIKEIAGVIKYFRMKAYDTNGFEASQVTAGGVPLSEFTSDLCSKRMENVYAIGEVLDVCGQCGGYNLHFAWASGYLVGESIGK